MKAGIIIPTYNERENVSDLIPEIFSHFPDVFILVVDDSSPDGTSDAVRQLQGNYPNLSLIVRPQKDGLGGAYISGFKKVLEDSSVSHIITMDGDFSHNPKYIPQFIEKSREFTLVVGSRYISSGGVKRWELWRRLLSKCANLYIRAILGFKVHDWTSGFNCISTDVLRKVNFNAIDLSGYAFLQELKYLLIKAGARVTEVPIVFESRREGESKISRFIIWEGIIGPWKIRKRK